LSNEVNIWKQALAIVEYWTLVPEDEMSDNQCPTQDGDGTSWNKALSRIRGRFEEELIKAEKEQRRKEAKP
jgi:hypothetical protein